MLSLTSTPIFLFTRRENTTRLKVLILHLDTCSHISRSVAKPPASNYLLLVSIWFYLCGLTVRMLTWELASRDAVTPEWCGLWACLGLQIDCPGGQGIMEEGWTQLKRYLGWSLYATMAPVCVFHTSNLQQRWGIWNEPLYNGDKLKSWVIGRDKSLYLTGQFYTSSLHLGAVDSLK